MTNKINGIDVSECAYFNSVIFEEPYCNIDQEHFYTCSSDENCYYKQLKRLQEENEKLKQVRKNYPDIQEPYIHLYRQIKKQCHKLEEENKSLQMLSCVNCGEKYLSPEGAELYDKNVQLQKENEELKEKVNSYNCNADCYKYKEADKYKQALEEIREITNEYITYCMGSKCEGMEEIQNKINEVLNDRD